MRYCDSSRKCYRIITGICVLAAASVAWGGVIRHDVDDALYLQLAGQTQYDPCGMVECGLVMGSGSLIANQWVLTAAHVVDEASGQVTFNLGGIEYRIGLGMDDRRVGRHSQRTIIELPIHSECRRCNTLLSCKSC